MCQDESDSNNQYFKGDSDRDEIYGDHDESDSKDSALKSRREDTSDLIHTLC